MIIYTHFVLYRINKQNPGTKSFRIDFTIEDSYNPLRDDDCSNDPNYSYAHCVEEKIKGINTDMYREFYLCTCITTVFVSNLIIIKNCKYFIVFLKHCNICFCL